VVSSDEGTQMKRLLSEDFQYPSQLFQCTETEDKKKVLKTGHFTKQDYEQIAESVNELYDDNED